MGVLVSLAIRNEDSPPLEFSTLVTKPDYTTLTRRNITVDANTMIDIQLDVAPVMLVVKTDNPVTLYFNGSVEGIAIDSLFVAMDSDITALAITASDVTAKIILITGGEDVQTT